jgi:predicted transcriptional regulator
MQILTKTTSVRLPSVTHIQLHEIAAKIQKHPSTIMREAIMEFVSTYRKSKTSDATSMELRS